MAQRYAILDLGTNTFSLLIVEAKLMGGWKSVYRDRIYVNLGESGPGHISEAAQERAMTAVDKFSMGWESMRVAPVFVRALATSAFRTAENGEDLAFRIRREFGISVVIIDGDQEASMIHKGVTKAVGDLNQDAIIMDIGGGSVEFIHYQNPENSVSTKLGVSTLTRKMLGRNPFSISDVVELKDYIIEELKKEWFSSMQFPILIGASGTFDVLSLKAMEVSPFNSLCTCLTTNSWLQLREELLYTTLEERELMEDLPRERIEMLPSALVLLDSVIELTGTEKIIVSPYALREGAIEEWIG
jgi:exopolyphosphatase / guanosine-5'-triphosphate,3'-diphosphate pyrophosphatase